MKPLIFDLDGTLVDSSDSILEGYRAALTACARAPVRPLLPELIGPPLRQTLALIAGSQDDAVLDPLVAAFKAHYDSAGYRLTRVFPGVAQMLASLAAAGHPMYIATNKRLRPTQLILENLGWAGLFLGVYALDAFAPPLADKAELLGRLLAAHGIAADAALYIGDRDEDGAAAAANGLPFAWASWGYGGGARAPAQACMSLGSPAELGRQLAMAGS